MKSNSHFIGKLIYSLLFLIAIPFCLWFWAMKTEDLIELPAFHSIDIGFVLVFIGLLLIAWAMLYLIIEGKGLPMNAYPPKYFVEKGPYRFFRHPIYWGFGIALIGYFILIGSSSGLWLVVPATILGMIAIVWGYERIDLKRRFPGASIRTILDLAKKSEDRPSFRDRIVSMLWVSACLLLGNFLVISLPANPPPHFGESINIDLELNRGILMILNATFMIIVPFLIKKKAMLRSWSIQIIIGIIILVFIALVLPSLRAIHVTQQGLNILTLPAFISLITIWKFYQNSKSAGLLISLPAIIIMIYQLPYSSSPFLDLGISILIFLTSINIKGIWIWLQKRSESIANSWHERTFGKVRIINHGFYVGFASFLGIFLSGTLAGKEYAWAILVFALVVIVFSALWAQIIEGSEKLKRPFGYYGALVGILFASLAVWAMGLNGWVVIGVVSVVMPWVQAIGRLRCLINGCCHGAKINNPEIGIRYHHHRSRVCGISGLKGELLHPTPLYSIIWLFFVGIVLLRFWFHQLPFTFIFGMYMVLTGLGRFVEEAYRGEVQTPVMKGLRLYQWTAIFSILIGMIMTMIPITPVDLIVEFAWDTGLAALIGGLFTTFAMGVDFPYSNARFSRLV